MRQSLHAILCVTLLCLLPAFLRAQTTPIIFDGDVKRIGSYLEIFQDTTNAMPIAEVARQDFKKCRLDVPNFDFTKATCWVRFGVTVQAEAARPILQIDYPLLDSLVLFRRLPDGKFERLAKSGIGQPFFQRDLILVNFLFNLPVDKGDTNEYYLKVKSTGQVILPMTLLSRTEVYREANTRNLLTGGYIGVLLVMVLYNAFIFFSIRDKSYLYFITYIIFIGLSQLMLTGYGFYLLFPDDPALNKFMIIGFPVFAGIAAVFFIRSFLDVDRQRHPYANTALLGVAVLYVIAFLFRLLNLNELSSRTLDVAGLAGAVVVYAVVLPMALRGYRPAIFLLVSWTLFIIGLVLFIMRNFNLLPFNLVTSYTMQAGTAAMVALLAIAIADKINVLERERRKAQDKALQIAMEKERIVLGQNIMLEQKVEERTSELEQAFNELKQAQTQLVEQEKMASLGQLTAGIAHEINNPINFVTSNVKPLQRDIDIVLDGFEQAAGLALEHATPERAAAVQELREDMDFEYLKDEIGFLLKGIREGSERTAEIVKGLRIFSRVDESDLKKTNVLDGLDSTAIIVNTLLNNKIKLEKNYAPVPMIECYPGKLNQVFLNIITNGIYAVNKRWGEQPGGQITITTSLPEEDKVRISIADNGTGMDEATRRKLFEPFFTTKDVGEGTGLGLSIVYNIIRRHNGSITVQSAPGEGTEFVIDLPILQPTLPPPEL